MILRDGAGFESLARRYRLRRALSLAAGAVGTALLAGAVTRTAGLDTAGASLVAAAALAATSTAGLVRLGRTPVDATAIARHLDRLDPATEESAELLLAAESDLSLAQRIQRRRVERALAGGGRIDLPDRVARRSAAAGLAAVAAAGAVLLMPLGGARATGADNPGPAEASAVTRPPRIRGVDIRIEPPRYTGRPVRSEREWEIDAEEGARIGWRVEVDAAVESASLVTTSADTIELATADGLTYAGSLEAQRNALYRIILVRGADTVAGDFHRLTVRPDAVPTLVVVRPGQRTEIPSGGPSVVDVEILAGDDYGIGATALVATVTTGEGEGVRFREQRLEFESRSARPGGIVLRRRLDLAALGMAPGDDLYFHAVARDNRVPVPNEGRSETVFISLADTAGVTGTLPTGLAITVAPEYFRSQRQIIIDTEKLIAERRSLPVQPFRDRANGIGIDQGLLRLRYGQFTGEEFEEGGADDTGHEHDTKENTTLLAESVKSKLKAAIAQMWEAELRLRTYRPVEALPFEYRALELLKQVQQDARVYVQRVGFEPPPLEPDRKRLTGKLDAIPDRRVTDSVTAAASVPAIREALALVRALSQGRPPRPEDATVIERGGMELATLAADDPGRHLDGLRDLRTLADSVRRGVQCAGCLSRGESALLRALPEPPAAAAPRAFGSPLARRYFEFLDRER